MNKYVIYTSITGKYDNLPQYSVCHPDFDYICFSNDYPDGSTQGIWKIKHIPYTSKNNILLSRFVKLLPHKVLKNYEYSLWIDSNLIIKTSEFYSYVLTRIKEEGLWYGIKHHKRDCIYDESFECIKKAYTSYFETRKQLKVLKKTGYPSHFGLFENNIILRKHSHPVITVIDEEWWSIFNKYSKRDQLSLFYLFWKHKFEPNYLLEENLNSRNVNMLCLLYHNKKSLKKRIQRRIRLITNAMLEKILPLDKIIS